MKNSILSEKAFAFAVKIVRLVQRLQSERKEFVLSRQILKSGTSPGANDREAEFAQSKKDFISKLSIGLKEANETLYFLELLRATDYITKDEFESLYKDCGEIKGIFISSIRTAKINALKKKSFAIIIFHFSLFFFI
ncbi:MAG: four helix bundle protein [Saprospiraceae bacterium]|nr:four helix bundle protein [Candidatus Opimibacter iunctus]